MGEKKKTNNQPARELKKRKVTGEALGAYLEISRTKRGEEGSAQ